MPKKSTPSTQKRADARVALVPASFSPNNLRRLPMLDPAQVQRDGEVVLVEQATYVTSGISIAADEIFFIKGQKLPSDGPWLGEADKIAWRDPETGLECIMMRHRRGYLGGYVGIPKSHPLWGFVPDAIPSDLGVRVHGGLTYGRICAEGPKPARKIREEARRICHVPMRPTRYIETKHGSDYRVTDEHAWWLGFECNHVCDVIPNDPPGRLRAFEAETGAVYRDDAYVLNEIQNLARQLNAIAEGNDPPPRHGGPLPPAGIDPKNGPRS